MQRKTIGKLFVPPALALAFALASAPTGSSQTIGDQGYFSGGGRDIGPNKVCAINVTTRTLFCDAGFLRCHIRSNGRVCIQGL